MNILIDGNNDIKVLRVVLHQLDVILDNSDNRFYLIVNNKEMMDQDGNYATIDKLSDDVNNLGSIHNNVRLVKLFNV